MKVKHTANLLPPDTSQAISRVEQLSWSPNGKKIASCLGTNNQVILFDGSNYEKKDKFALKSIDKDFSRKSFAVKGLCFSPDSTKIAIAQTDCVIYVYKVGDSWEEKKSIVARYPLQSPVTCLYWHDSGIIFGSADGKVRFIANNSNRISSLLSTNSMVIAMSIDGDLIAAAYLNGSIFVSSLGQKEGGSFQVASHSCAPFGISLSSSSYLCVCGSDGKIVFLQLANFPSRSVINKQVIEYGSELFSVSAFPSGNTVVVISLNRMIVFTLDSHLWRQTQIVELDGVPLISTVTHSRDGTKLILGTISGAVELFSCEWKKKLIAEKFEINYVGLSQIVLTDIKTGNSNIFRSEFEIKDVKIIQSTHIVIWTTRSLLIASLTDPEKISEIEWTRTCNKVKFCFDYKNLVLVSSVGELFVVELGSNYILTSVRSDFVDSNLISVTINQRNSNAKVLAYLLDLKTVAVVDLVSGVQICTWSSDEQIDWVEMNETGKLLLFRDRVHRLHYLDILTHESEIILNFCQFARWVSRSDVIVAQSHEKIYVWYDLSKPVIHDIAGDARAEAVAVIREKGVTKVIFSGNTPELVLDEMLIEFDTALKDDDLRRAMSFLESCSMNVESESMWRTLARVALRSADISVAERAYAAVGDLARSNFIQECFDDEAKLALLENNWTMFETSPIEEVVETYIRLHKWEKAIEAAEEVGRSDLRDDLERRYFDYLIDSGQQAEAGRLMEGKKRYEDAIKLYIKSGHSIQAANLIFDLVSKENVNLSRSLVEELIKELKNARFYEEVGRLYLVAPLNNVQMAFETFLEGKCFSRAIELARSEFPEEVVKIEEEFGTWLVTEGKDPSTAIYHFVEAGKIDRALEAAISANQFDKAAELTAILDHIPAHLGRPIASHYESIGEIEAAQNIYLGCGCIQDAIALLNRHNQFQRAYKLARQYFDSQAAREMYVNMAKEMEKEGKLKEAERIYITCDDVDAAISMYKNQRQFDNMVRLVKQYHPDLLNDTHLHLAREMETEGQLNQAESHFIAASEWKSAVRMYKNAGKWEDAYRVARSYGGAVPAKQVAFLWAKSLSHIDMAVKLLSRLGLLNQVVDYAVECNAFEWAKNLVTNAGPELKHKINEVKLKYALWLEEEQRFDEAETLFLEANKPKEAVLMYLHNKSFSDALRIAEAYVKDENSVSDILVAEARSILEKADKSGDNLMKAESLMLRAGRIELAVKMYKDIGMWDEAIRVCEQYSPALIDSVKRDMVVSSRMSGVSSSFERYVSSSRRTSSRGSLKSRNSSIAIESDGQSDQRAALEAAEASGDRIGIIRSALALASQLISKKAYEQALQILTSYQISLTISEARIVLLRLSSSLMAFENESEYEVSVWRHLRNAFLNYLTSSSTSQDEKQLEKHLLLSHYLCLKKILASLSNQHVGAKSLLSKLSTSLLRYTDILRVDKCFYEAGKMAKEDSKFDLAFIFWNHFLDLVDAIEEGDVNVDHSDFVDTDIPSEVPLPPKPFSLESEPNLVEDVKSWILQMSMDSRAVRSLPKDPDRGHVYEASLSNGDGTYSQPCLVTGYPVLKAKMLELRPQKYVANKDDWNKLLMLTKISASEELKDTLLFIGKLCGNATIARFTF